MTLFKRFLAEEDGDAVQTAIIVAIFAGIAILFGEAMMDFVQGIIANLVGQEDRINISG